MRNLMQLVNRHPLLRGELGSHSLKLAPFLNSVVIYFIFVRDPQGELWTTLLKCLPILMLVMYIWLKGFGTTSNFNDSQRIAVGLIFSCLGDALLNIGLFPHGMGSFALAQTCYIAAFGFKPLRLDIGIPLYLAGAATVAAIFQSLDAVLAIGLPIYTTLLLTMCWRAWARGLEKRDNFHMLCAVGSVLFVISDGFIAVDMFFFKLPAGRILIMATYYAAQLLITLSTATEGGRQVKVSPKRSKMSIQSRINGAEIARRRVKPRD